MVVKKGPRAWGFPRGGLVGLAAAVLVSCGFLLGLLAYPDVAPASLTAAATVRTAGVAAIDFTDERSLAFSPQVEPLAPLASPRSGVVTSSACAPGKDLASGEVLFTIDSEPVVALWTAYPLFRDIGLGLQGADVSAVGDELRRLGYGAPESAVWNAGSAQALAAFLQDRGAGGPGTVLALDRFVLLSAETVRLSSCSVEVRGRVGTGDVLALSGGGLTGLTAVQTETLAAGGHSASYGAVTAPLSPEGLIVDAAFLSEVAAGPEFKTWQAGQEGGLALKVALTEPAPAFALPPSALYALTADRACVLAGDGQAVAVTLLSSSLGNSIVAAAAPLAEVVLAPTDPPPCR
ncbi:MAG: hypothetical protein LBI84_06540 [Propionibacteriaceae bacterium]|jgi:hypothetical protein|nr:hypothetical protein [Propionibacteriaceae bacterium]